MPIFDKLSALLRQTPVAPPDTVAAPFERRHVAVIALLIELAQSDRDLGTGEFAAIERIVRERLGFDAISATRIIAAARSELDAALEDWVFAKAVRDGFDAPGRVGIVELLWEVVYADGRLARLEVSSLGRIAAMLGIAEAECEAARAQAFARSNVSDTTGPGSMDAE